MTLSAQAIFATAPLGAIVHFANGEPRPPAHHKRKLRAWEDRNGRGRLTRRSPGGERYPADFTLHLGNWGEAGAIVLSVSRSFQVTSESIFQIEQVPSAGQALVVTEFAGRIELQHVANDRASAEAWLTEHRYHNARIEIVEPTADEASPGQT